jgi:hypothetical protein
MGFMPNEYILAIFPITHTQKWTTILSEIMDVLIYINEIIFLLFMHYIIYNTP